MKTLPQYYFDNNKGQMLLIRIDGKGKDIIQEITVDEYAKILAFHDEQRAIRNKFLDNYFKEAK